MRLFLSSQDFGDYGQIAGRLVGSNKKAAYMKNAQDHLPPQERNRSTPEKKKLFAEAGLELEEIDLRDFFNKSEALKDKLSKYGSLWSSGGNTFILRRAFSASGLDKILKEMLDKDEIAYGGWSAGACIAAPSLKGLDTDRADFPREVPEGYPSKIIWDAMDLVPFYMVPHYGSDWFGKQANALKIYYEENNLPYRLLKDGQVIVIDGEKEEFLK